jgi:hypothetical protein
MFGLGPIPEMLIGVALVLLAEVAVFWAAASLGDVGPLSWIKLLLVVLGVTALASGIIALVVWFSGSIDTLLAEDNRLLAGFVGAVALLVLWAVPAVLYVPLLSVSIPRSMLIAVFQWLLRGFLYLLITAVVMVVLAGIQIYKGGEIRSQLPSSPTLARSV